MVSVAKKNANTGKLYNYFIMSNYDVYIEGKYYVIPGLKDRLKDNKWH